MTDATDPRSHAHPQDHPHPRGTVYIVAIFGALVALGWLVFFFGLFLPRNTP